MRVTAYLWAVLLSSCSVQSPCEAQGGLCALPQTECGPKYRYVGIDPACEPMSKCCVPVDGRVDAGSSCPGVCYDKGHVCESGTNPVAGGSCPVQGTCCNKLGTTCVNKNGKCQSRDLPCAKVIGGTELCGIGNQCCG